jgi:hypothetical protein
MFTGKRHACEVDVAAVLGICGVKGPARDGLLKIAREAHEPGWWQDYEDRLPRKLTALIDYEDSSAAIVNYSDTKVPGLLQVPDYIRTLHETSPTIPEDEVEPRIEARVGRQEILNRLYPPYTRFFIDEYALRRTGPGRTIMSEQVHHLLRMSVRRNVEIRVIPDSVGFHASQKPFHLMEFGDQHPVVHLEDQTCSLLLERKKTTTAYRRITTGLEHVALTEEQSREWIAALANELGEPREECDEEVELAEFDVDQWPDGKGSRGDSAEGEYSGESRVDL